MPPLPRCRDGKLWILNVGSGEVVTLDAESRHLEPMAFCPDDFRKMTFVGPSEPRGTNTYPAPLPPFRSTCLTDSLPSPRRADHTAGKETADA